MNIEEIQSYCLSKKCTTEDMPFDDTTLVFKVCGKIFALLSLDSSFGLNLKCDPLKAIELREQYPSIVPGYHMNKSLWNSIKLNGSLNSKFIQELIDHSYEQVVMKLPLKTRKDLL